MIIYFLPVAISLVGFFLNKLLLIPERFFFVFALFFLFIVVSLKGSVDLDYYSYQTLYNAVVETTEKFPYSSNENLKFEKGFLFVLSVFKELDFKFNSIFLFYAFFTSFLIFLICRLLVSTSVNFSFVFLYSVSFVGIWVQIRFGLAALGLLLSIIYFFKSNYFKSFFVCLFSLLTHNIVLAVLMPVLFYILLNKFKIRKLFICFILLVISFFVFLDFSNFFEVLLVFFNDRYIAYIDESLGSSKSYFIRVFFFLVMLFLIRKDLFNMSALNRFLLCMSFSSVLVFMIASKIVILYRLGVAFEMGYLMFFMRENYSNKNKYVIALMFMFSFILYRLLDVPSIVEPYKTFWID